MISETETPNKITGANAGRRPQSPTQTRWTARVAQFCRSPKMKATSYPALLYLFLTISCSPPVGSPFVAAFNPLVMLNKIGTGAGVSYSNGSAGTSSSGDLVRGAQIQKHWSFSFQGSHAQLSDQLDGLRAEVERQLSSSNGKISGRGKWAGDFSGFSFDYRSGGRTGFVRVTGISLESGRQAVEVLVYEH
jgi:hypothetical protein